MVNKLFNKLFVFEMANNHMGDVNHGLAIINKLREASKGFDFNFGVKLQYRELDSFIHPDYKGREDIKYVKRFSETRLSSDEFKKIKDEIVKSGFISICTPFDEKSVELIEEHNFDIIKIASCSLTDWPLLERISETSKPIIASTGGASLGDMDKVVSFFEHREKELCLMHCVGEYPVSKEKLQLNQIDFLKKRYPDISIGYSTHEEPDNYDAIKIAIGKGADVFERHVGVKTPEYSLNAYSSTPDQIHSWLKSAEESLEMCGVLDKRREISEKEENDLRGLKRGVFAKREINKGEKINLENSFLAIPNVEDQVLANDMSKYKEFVSNKDVKVNAPIMIADVTEKNLRGKVLQIITNVSKILKESKIILPHKLELEISHHYGIEKYDEWGATIINCINREYCKKLIILLPGQKHPGHFHRKKEETFHILYGDMVINLKGEEKEYRAGDMVVVEREAEHAFSSKTGAVFEEVSTTHYKDDSFYEDDAIINNKNRKTEMTFWSDWLYKPIF